MLKSVTTATAVAALMAASPVLALDPAPLPPTAPAAGQSETNSMVNDQAAAIAEQPMFLDQQEESTTLASSLIGTTVYDAADRSLGDVNDLVLGEGGKVMAIVVGVGGFLGIGEKNVAISLAAVGQTVNADGTAKLVLDTTAEELESAPPFMTLAELHRQQEQNTQPPPGPEGVIPAPAM